MENEARGRDATGIGYLSPEGLVIDKRAVTATEFVRDQSNETWVTVATSALVLGHTRAATKGPPSDNDNNHPIDYGGWVVVHNGTVFNDDAIFEHYSAPRYAAVDTAAIPLALEKGGATYNEQLLGLTKLAGNVSVAAWNNANPLHLALARLGYNDVFLFDVPEWEALVFSSDSDAYKHLPTRNIGAIAFLTAARLPENHLLVLSPGGPTAAVTYAVTRAPLQQRPVAPLTTDTTSFKWYNTNADQRRPPPDFAACKPISVNNFDFAAACDKAEREPASSLVVPTPYGRWISAPGTITFFFRAHRSMKKYMRRQKLIAWWEDVSDESPLSLDGKLRWEVAVLSDRTVPNGAALITTALVCPWCGCLDHRFDVLRNNGVCEWCEHRSVIYESPGGTAK